MCIRDRYHVVPIGDEAGRKERPNRRGRHPRNLKRSSSTLAAVSYTHLDVYKRQVLHVLPAEHSRTDTQHFTGVPIDELGKVIGEDLAVSLHQQPVPGKPAKFQPLAPVSYTHLDVYKRQ